MARVVLIVGGSSGIGKACAIKFSSRGYHTIIAGLSKEKLEKVCDELKENGKSCSYFVFDIRSKKSIDNLLERLKRDRKVIDILINSAGINAPCRSFQNMNDGETQDIINTNLVGAINLSNALINQMRKFGGGTIIHMGSTAGIKTTALSGVAYSATKRGLFSLVRSINLEESKNGIRASIIAPATVNTELLLSRPKAPTGEMRKKVLQPETVAEIAFFIAEQPKNVVIEQVVLTSSSEVEFL